MKPGKIIGFYKKRWIYFCISLSIMLFGTIMIFVNGVTLDIQFKGGAIIKYTYSGDVDANIAQDIATKQLNRPVTAQLTKDFATGEQKLVFTLAGEYGVATAEQTKFDDALKTQFPNAELKLSESQMVEKFFGDKFLHNGIMALLLAAVLIMAYVAFRFSRMGGLSAGVTAIISLIHDVFIVFFTFVIFKLPIGESFVAVSMTIIGYSINDTIVIYDRIRENAKKYEGYPVDTVSDLSISQCIVRSISTNFTFLISISMVYILAFAHNIQSIMTFALPMAIGTISGCYSTICIAGPLWVMWKKRKGDTILFKEKEPEKAKVKSSYKYKY
ncbi:MAG TPA: protein translocase subunit SecF [Mobilitalea sp.]|nr:protein translocase subunit SecF [Mobilitalea sp.]